MCQDTGFSKKNLWKWYCKSSPWKSDYSISWAAQWQFPSSRSWGRTSCHCGESWRVLWYFPSFRFYSIHLPWGSQVLYWTAGFLKPLIIIAFFLKLTRTLVFNYPAFPLKVQSKWMTCLRSCIRSAVDSGSKVRSLDSTSRTTFQDPSPLLFIWELTSNSKPDWMQEPLHSS